MTEPGRCDRPEGDSARPDPAPHWSTAGRDNGSRRREGEGREAARTAGRDTDGYVWYLRRRRTRRRRPWSRPGRPPLARFHDEEELPAEELPIPPWIDLWRLPNLEVGERGLDRFNDDRHAASNAVEAAVVGVVALSVLAWLTVQYLLPWLLPWLASNARLVLWLIAALAVALGLNQLHRPWYVELQRQGLADAPRRVWRVQGWRRSGRLMGELTAAIQEGRIDTQRGTVILRQVDRDA